MKQRDSFFMRTGFSRISLRALWISDMFSGSREFANNFATSAEVILSTSVGAFIAMLTYLLKGLPVIISKSPKH